MDGDAGNGRVRVTCRMDRDAYERVRYWADRHGETASDYLVGAVALRIAYDNHDFDLDDVTVQRIGQLVEAQRQLSERVGALEDTVTAAVRSILQLTRGDSYLTDELGSDAPSDGGGA